MKRRKYFLLTALMAVLFCMFALSACAVKAVDKASSYTTPQPITTDEEADYQSASSPENHPLRAIDILGTPRGTEELFAGRPIPTPAPAASPRPAPTPQPPRAMEYEVEDFRAWLLGVYSYQTEHDIIAHELAQFSAWRGFEVILPEDFEATLFRFDYFDFISPEAFYIAREYLRQQGIAQGEFHDQVVMRYVSDIMGSDAARHYDSIPFEDMADNPRRILVRMFEAWMVASSLSAFDIQRYLGQHPHEVIFFGCLTLGRTIYDWRE